MRPIDSRMNGFEILGLVLTVSVVGLLVFEVPAQSQLGRGVASNFLVPATKDSQGRTVAIKGDTGKMLSNGVVELTGLTLTISGGDGNRDFIVEAKSCFWDQKSGMASSSGALSLRSRDGRFVLSGVGFRFDQSKSALAVSNSVDARLAKSLAGSPLALGLAFAGSSTNATNSALSVAGPGHEELVEIRSANFEFTPERVVFRGEVRVSDGETSVNAERLTGRFAPNGGSIDRIEAEGEVRFARGDLKTTSETAVYSPGTDRAVLHGNVHWQIGNKAGTADDLTLEGKERRFIANGDVSLKFESAAVMPMEWLGSKPGSAPQSAREILIRSHGLEYAGDKATFSDMVWVSDSVGTELTAEVLELGFHPPDNTITRFMASNHVQLRSGDVTLSGSRANFATNNGLLIFEGAPEWSSARWSGTSDSVVLDSKEKEFRASGHVHSKVSGAAWRLPASGRGNGIGAATAKEAAPRNLRIDSDRVVAMKDKTVFLGGALVVDESDSTQELRAEVLAAFFSENSRVDHLLAEESVRIHSGQSEAFGEKAAFDVAGQMIDLSGSPRVRMPGQLHIADRFVFDLARRTVETIGAWRTELDPPAMGTAQPK